MQHEPIQQKFAAALDALVEHVQGDRSVLAAILCGSLSHDTVWAKSDIDLVMHFGITVTYFHAAGRTGSAVSFASSSADADLRVYSFIGLPSH